MKTLIFLIHLHKDLFDNPELTQEEAIRQMYPGISGVQTAEKLQENFMADVYIQAAIRQEIVDSTYKKSCACEAVWT